MLHHGGRLIEAANHYGIPLQDWLDLSTGLNPEGWPVGQIPAEVFQRLPQEEDGLLQVAENYYQARDLLATSGSQSVIQLLPWLRESCRVGVPAIGYAEHAHAWQQAGHRLEWLTPWQIDEKLDQLDVLVVINPNNPAADYYSVKQLLDWHQRLQQRNGWLIIDEAFMDSRPENSLACHAHQAGLIVLRSLGKFFGLAGIRSGFVIAQVELLDKIHQQLGPWAVSGPSRYISQRALADTRWQQSNRQKLRQQSTKLKQLLEQFIASKDPLARIKGTDLFQTIFCENARQLHQSLAENSVFTRLLDNSQGVRFGLPEQTQWNRLQQVLMSL